MANCQNLQASSYFNSLCQITFIWNLNHISPQSLIILSKNWSSIFSFGLTWRGFGYRKDIVEFHVISSTVNSLDTALREQTAEELAESVKQLEMS